LLELAQGKEARRITVHATVIDILGQLFGLHVRKIIATFVISIILLGEFNVIDIRFVMVCDFNVERFTNAGWSREARPPKKRTVLDLGPFR